MKKLFVAAAVLMCTALAACGASSNAGGAADPIIGKWQLTSVEAAEEGKEAEVLDKEGHQSFYSAADGFFTFEADGKGTHTIQDGGDSFDRSASWTKSGDTYTVKEDDGLETVFTFDSSADTLTNVLKDMAPYAEIRFIYTRIR